MRIKSGRLAGLAILLAMGSATALRAEGPPPGTISLDTQTGAPELDSTMPIFIGAVDDALAARGFTVLEGAGHAGLVAHVRLTRTVVGGVNAKVKPSKASIGAGGAEGVGASAAVPFGTGKIKEVALQQTRLDIAIGKRGENAILWHGAAVTVRPAGTPAGRDEAVAASLAQVILHDYPAQADDAVSIP